MNRLDEIKKALDHVVWFDHADGSECLDMRLIEKALTLLNEIQNEQAVDVVSLKKELPCDCNNQHGRCNENLYANGWNECLDLLSSKGLLRTNEIEPEGRG